MPKGLISFISFILILLSIDFNLTSLFLTLHIKSGSHPNNENLPLCSPPSTDSNKKEYLKVIVCQIVRLFKDNQLLKISKREGNFVTLEEIYKQVGKDPLRYFMISTKNETPMDFYMDKVVEKNKDNPVFYCQYAYARASSVINNAKKLSNIDISKINFKDFVI